MAGCSGRRRVFPKSSIPGWGVDLGAPACHKKRSYPSLRSLLEAASTSPRKEGRAHVADSESKVEARSSRTSRRMPPSRSPSSVIVSLADRRDHRSSWLRRRSRLAVSGSEWSCSRATSGALATARSSVIATSHPWPLTRKVPAIGFARDGDQSLFWAQWEDGVGHRWFRFRTRRYRSGSALQTANASSSRGPSTIPWSKPPAEKSGSGFRMESAGRRPYSARPQVRLPRPRPRQGPGRQRHGS